jgi:hypothetical protein
MNAVVSHDVVRGTAAPAPPQNWKLALALGGAGGVASILLMPYALALAKTAPQTMGLPLPVALLISFLQSSLLLFLLSWAGLRLGAAIGLDAPVLRAWMSKRAPAERGHWLAAAALGIVAGAAIVLLDATIFQHAMSAAMAEAGQAAPHVARWKGALASFYGGIAEEIQLRLFFMTLIAWCLAKVTRSTSPSPLLFAVANVVAALAFGAGHLPMAAQVFGGLTTMVVVRTIVLNALAGIVFGALYSRWGLERAMVAHFCADIVLHVVLGA